MKLNRIKIICLLISIALAMVFRSMIMPPRSVNYLNYLLLRGGFDVDSVEATIGKLPDSDVIVDVDTGATLGSRIRQKGLHTAIWRDQNVFHYYFIEVTFIDGRLVHTEFFSPSL